MKPRYSSNSDIFRRRGNPWVSRREGENDFGRILETENPEMDQFTRARKAEPKPPFVSPSPTAKPAEGDFATRKANALAKMHRDMREHSGHMVKQRTAPHLFKPCPGCRLAVCISNPDADFNSKCQYPRGRPVGKQK